MAAAAHGVPAALGAHWRFSGFVVRMNIAMMPMSENR
jgi:hypothetical protein